MKSISKSHTPSKHQGDVSIRLNESNKPLKRLLILPVDSLIMGVLVVVFLGLQFRLWSFDGGFLELKNTSERIFEQKEINEELTIRNQRMREEINDLKINLNVIESKARQDLGLIREGEVFYMIVDKKNDEE